jgi:hypothetical protein
MGLTQLDHLVGIGEAPARRGGYAEASVLSGCPHRGGAGTLAKRLDREGVPGNETISAD